MTLLGTEERSSESYQIYCSYISLFVLGCIVFIYVATRLFKAYRSFSEKTISKSSFSNKKLVFGSSMVLIALRLAYLSASIALTREDITDNDLFLDNNYYTFLLQSAAYITFIALASCFTYMWTEKLFMLGSFNGDFEIKKRRVRRLLWASNLISVATYLAVAFSNMGNDIIRDNTILDAVFEWMVLVLNFMMIFALIVCGCKLRHRVIYIIKQSQMVMHSSKWFNLTFMALSFCCLSRAVSFGLKIYLKVKKPDGFDMVCPYLYNLGQHSSIPWLVMFVIFYYAICEFMVSFILVACLEVCDTHKRKLFMPQEKLKTTIKDISSLKAGLLHETDVSEGLHVATLRDCDLPEIFEHNLKSELSKAQSLTQSSW